MEKCIKKFEKLEKFHFLHLIKQKFKRHLINSGFCGTGLAIGITGKQRDKDQGDNTKMTEIAKMYSPKIKMSVITTFILSIIALFMGCSPPLDQIRVFGAATGSLGDNSKKAFQLINDSTIDRKIYDVAIDPCKYPKDDVFEGLLTDEGLRVRIDVLDNLGKYATSLEKLASADFKKEVDEAATDLYGALSGLKKNYKAATNRELDISDNQMAIIASAVKVLGDAIIESKRRSAIKAIIIEADDAVQTVTSLLAQEFRDDSPITLQVRNNLSNADSSLRQIYNKERETPTSTFDERYQMLIKIRKLYEASKSSKQLFRDIHNGVVKIGKAHSALKEAVRKDKFTSENFTKELADLVFYVKSAAQFYENLKRK